MIGNQWAKCVGLGLLMYTSTAFSVRAQDAPQNDSIDTNKNKIELVSDTTITNDTVKVEPFKTYDQAISAADSVQTFVDFQKFIKKADSLLSFKPFKVKQTLTYNLKANKLKAEQIKTNGVGLNLSVKQKLDNAKALNTFKKESQTAIKNNEVPYYFTDGYQALLEDSKGIGGVFNSMKDLVKTSSKNTGRRVKGTFGNKQKSPTP